MARAVPSGRGGVVPERGAPGGGVGVGTHISSPSATSASTVGVGMRPPRYAPPSYEPKSSPSTTTRCLGGGLLLPCAPLSNKPSSSTDAARTPALPGRILSRWCPPLSRPARPLSSSLPWQQAQQPLGGVGVQEGQGGCLAPTGNGLPETALRRNERGTSRLARVLDKGLGQRLMQASLRRADAGTVGHAADMWRLWQLTRMVNFQATGKSLGLAAP